MDARVADVMTTEAMAVRAGASRWGHSPGGR
jgi:hypothetical protein